MPDLCNQLPANIVCQANGGGSTVGPPTVTLATAVSRQTYSTGEAVGFKLTVANGTSNSMTISSISNPVPTGFLAMPADGITMDGAPCNANTSPACTVGTAGLSVSSFALSKNQQHVFAYAMVVTWSPRGCGQLTNQSVVSSSNGAVTASAPVTGCDGGLGGEPWWSYVSEQTGPQGSVAMNANSGNLVATQDDSTPIPGHGRLVLEPHRVYNSQYSGYGAPPNAFGTGWLMDFEHWTGSGQGTTDVGGLFVPSAESVSTNHAVTVIDDAGGRRVVPLQFLPTPIDVTGLQQQGDTRPWSVVVPRVLQLDTSKYDHICVDENSAPAAGLHLGLWRYTEVKAAGTTTPCTPASGTAPVVLGWGAERPDRVRYEFAWNGAKLDAEDGNANEVKYAYASAPAAGVSLGHLASVTEVSSGRAFTLAYPSSTETDITDAAGRKTTYLFSSAGLLTSVGNPDGHSLAYAYGSSCSGAATTQLCSIADPRGNRTSFTYTSAWSDGTAVVGPPKLATITDRTGAVSTITHVHSPDNVTVDRGIERTRSMNFDAAGSVGEIDGIDMTNSASPTTLHQALYSWDTASGATPCTQPDAVADHNLCRSFRESGGTGTAEDTTYTYNMVGQSLVVRQCLASSDSTTPPPCPTSTTTAVTSRDSSWGYQALYVEATGTATVYTDTPQGGGTVSSTGVTGGTRWDGQTLYALYDNVATLDARGNAPGLSSSQVQSYLHNLAADDSSAVAPDRQVAAGTCPTVAADTGNVCTTSGPGGSPSNNYSYVYDRYGQRTSMSTPNVLATSGAQPFVYTYYADTDHDLTGHTSAGGWLKAETDPYGHFTAYAYDAAGNLTRTWDKDATSGLALSAFPGAASSPPNTAYSEVQHGSGTNPYLSPWRYVLASRDQLNDLTTYTVDANGNVLTIRPPLGNQAANSSYDTTQTYNARDQLTSKVTPVEALLSPREPWTFSYDQWGNRSSVTDPRGVVTVNLYDAVNRLRTTRYTLAPSGSELTPSSCTASQASDAPIPTGRILCSRSQSYDMVDNITSRSDGNAQVTTLDYDGVHEELDRYVPRNDGTYTTLRTGHAYDLDGNVTIICPPRTFTDGGATSCTNPGNNWTAYETTETYDTQGHVASSSTYRPGRCAIQTTAGCTGIVVSAQTYSFQYDPDGNRTVVSDPNTHTRTTVYDLVDRPTSLTVQRSATSSVQTTDTYDPAGHLLSQSLGTYAAAYAYDAAGRLTDEVKGWDGTSAATTATATSDGGTNIHSRRIYDADGNVVNVYDPRAFAGGSADQRTFMMTAVYDHDGRETAQYVPRYDGGSYSDLSSGSSTQSTQCPGNTAGYPTTVGVCVTSLAYDGVGDVIEEVLPTATNSSTARKVDYSYTDDQHQLVITEPSAAGGTATRQFNHDAEGRMVKSLDELSRATTIAYTSDGLQETVTAEPNGSITHVTSYAYDANGNQLSVVDPAGLKTSYTYTWDNRVQTEADNAGDTTQYQYDAAGNPTQVLSPSAYAKVAPNTSGTAVVNNYTYDNLLLTSTKPFAPDGSEWRETTYDYADFGGKTSQDVSLWQRTTTISNGVIFTSTQKLADAGAQSFTYYPDERLRQETGRDGSTINYLYDPAGNKTSVGSGGSSLTASYYLDDLVRSVTDSAPVSGSGTATSSFGYDGLGNVTSQQEQLSTGGQYTTGYTYGDAEVPTAESTSWMGNWSWTYDAAGQVQQESDPNGDVAYYGWYADGTLNRRQYQVAATGGIVSEWDYTYDSDYRQASRDFHGATANNQPVALYMTYAYDNAGRLSTFHRSDLSGNNVIPDMTAHWDVDGNRTSWSDGTAANTTTTTYNADDSIATQVTNGNTSYGYSYNTAGDLANDGCRSYSYDGFDQMTSFGTANGANCGRIESGSYAYDALGRQVMVSDGPYGAATAVHFSGLSSSPAAEQQETGRTANVVYALAADGSLLGDMFAPGAFNRPEYLAQDGYSSITNATGSNGQVTCDSYTDPFGAPFAGSGSNPCHTGAMNDTLLYRQARRDPTSGAYQMGARIYDPSKAGFAQPDSYRVDGSNLALETDPRTQNGYAYAGGDPVNNSDPTGHDICRENPQDCVDDQGKADQQLMNGQAVGTRGGTAQQVSQAEHNGLVHQQAAEQMRRAARAPEARERQLAWLNAPTGEGAYLTNDCGARFSVDASTGALQMLYGPGPTGCSRNPGGVCHNPGGVGEIDCGRLDAVPGEPAPQGVMYTNEVLNYRECDFSCISWLMTFNPLGLEEDFGALGADLAKGLGAKLADAGAHAINIGDKITGQLADRGWTEQSVRDMVNGAPQKYPVWDYTTGTAQPATAYATGSNSYVVVNDATGEVVQVSDLNNTAWKPVWNDPRFQR